MIIQALSSAASLDPAEWFATSAGVGVGSFIAYLSARPSRVVFDAARSEVRWQHRGWPGHGRGSCPLSQVIRVEVHADPSRAERLALITASGVVPLTRDFSGFNRHTESAALVREWLELHGTGT